MNAYDLIELDRVAIALEVVSINLTRTGSGDLANFSWRAFEKVERVKRGLARELFGDTLPDNEIGRVMKILREEYPNPPTETER